MRINRENFYIASFAPFVVADAPKRLADYISTTNAGALSSKYWFTENGVSRESGHWLEVAACEWVLFEKDHTLAKLDGMVRTGFANWHDFFWRRADEIPDLQGLLRFFKKLNNDYAVEQIKKQYNL